MDLGIDATAYTNLSHVEFYRTTKSIIRECANPAMRKHELEMLQNELFEFESSLPTDFRLSTKRLLLKTHSTDAGGYITLHIQWFQCNCDLHRLFIPGIRESVGKDILDNTPPDLVDACQRACLSNAIRACNFLAELDCLNYSGSLGSTFPAVAAHQMVCILHHLHHLLPPDGPDALPNLKPRLARAINVISRNQLRRGNVFDGKLLADTQSLVIAFGKKRAPQSNGGKYRRRNPQYLPSSGSFLDHFDETSEAAQTDILSKEEQDDQSINCNDGGSGGTDSDKSDMTPLTVQEVRAIEGLISSSRSYIMPSSSVDPPPTQPAWLSPLSFRDSDIAVRNTNINVDESEARGDLGFIAQQEQASFESWDPLNAYINGYYIPEFTAMFSASEI